MFKYFVSILLFVFVAISSKSQDSKIIVGGDFNYPPYSYVNELGKEVGYDVDVINAIAQQIDLKVDFNFTYWDTTLRNLELGKIDVIASIVYSKEREKKYDFTFPLHTEYYAIFALKNKKIIDLPDLKGKQAAYLEGDISNESFLSPMGLLSDSVPVYSLPEGFNELTKGNCDYVIAPYPLGMRLIKQKKLRTIEVKGPPIIPSVYCLAVKQGNSELLSQLNMGIEELSRNGELEQIYKKWVKYRRSDEQYKSLFNYSLYVLMGLVALSLILALFWYSLRIQVAKKTRQIRDAEKIYQNVFNTVDEALIIFSNDGFIVDANAKAMKLYNMSYSEIVGVEYLKIISPENVPLFENLIETLDSETFFYQGEVKKDNGDQTLYLKINGVRITLDAEERYLAVIQDVTNDKNNLIQLEEAKVLAEHANSTKSIFLATVSHEIRTPINAIIGYTDILKKTNLDQKQLDYVTKVNLSSEILFSLVNDVLDLTKIEAGKLELIEKPFNVKDVIDKVYEVQLLKTKHQNLEISIDYSDDIPNTVLGDELRLMQVLLNLLSNALKFTHEGGVSLKVNFENIPITKSNRSRINLLFSVKDTGIGISPTQLDTLFEPFVQVQNTNKRQYGGTGLGLAISKQLVDLMQGEILVESELNKGSIFNVSIPFEICEHNIVPELKSIHDFPNLSKLEVLLVEDNEFNAEILIEQLADSELSIAHADSGYKALELIKKQDFHVVLMDIEMPGMDGFETTEALIKQGIKTPIIALTAHALESERERALSLGMVDYLNKPVKVEKLLNTILKYVNVSMQKVESNGVLNFSEGLAFFDDNKDTYKRTLERFVKSYEALANKLSLLAENDQEQLRSIMHNLKSASKTIGAIELSTKAKEMEHLLQKGTPPDNNALLSEIEEDLKSVLKAINVYV